MFFGIRLPVLPVPPIPILSWIIQFGIGFLLLALIIRAIASMLRLDESFAFIRFLARLTDPFIEPLRRILRPVGILDISFFVAFFMLNTLEILLLQSLPQGW